MAILESAARKHVVAIYFHRNNGENMKAFAARLRADHNNPVDTVLIWGQLFNIDDMLIADAVVVEKGVPNSARICEAYRRIMPNAEIHHVTREGEFYDPSTDEDPDTDPKPVIQTPAPAEIVTAPDVADPTDQHEEPGSETGDAEDIGDGSTTDSVDDAGLSDEEEDTVPPTS